MGSLSKRFKNNQIERQIWGQEIDGAPATLRTHRASKGARKRYHYDGGRRPLERLHSRSFLRRLFGGGAKTAEGVRRVHVFMAPFPDTSRTRAMDLVGARKRKGLDSMGVARGVLRKLTGRDS